MIKLIFSSFFNCKSYLLIHYKDMNFLLSAIFFAIFLNKYFSALVYCFFLARCFFITFGINNLHFINQMFGVCILVDDEQNISYIYHNVSAYSRVVINVAHGSFPNTVKVQSDQVSVCVNRRRA